MSRPNTTPPAWHAAAAAGEKRYYDPRPCKRGHLGERWTANLRCIQCAAEVRQGVVTPSTPASPLRAALLAALADPVQAREVAALLRAILLQGSAG